MKLVQQFKSRYHRSWLAALWHRYAPHVTVGKKFFGATVFMDLCDNIDDLTRSKAEIECREGCVLSLPAAVDGLVWDVGANVGLFSVRSSILGRSCIAFEMSPKACRLLEKTKKKGQFAFTIVNRAFTVDSVRYNPPESASTENCLAAISDGELLSCSFLSAAESFGIPALIKMDIEGGEDAFFRSILFKKWIVRNCVAWLVEIHERHLGYTPEWNDVPHCTLRGGHVLYAASDNQLQTLVSRLDAFMTHHTRI